MHLVKQDAHLCNKWLPVSVYYCIYCSMNKHIKDLLDYSSFLKLMNRQARNFNDTSVYSTRRSLVIPTTNVTNKKMTICYFIFVSSPASSSSMVTPLAQNECNYICINCPIHHPHLPFKDFQLQYKQTNKQTPTQSVVKKLTNKKTTF
jgi:hypothetical protein